MADDITQAFNAGVAAQKLQNLDESVRRMEARLLGTNGTPGMLAILDKKIEDERDKLVVRIDSLEGSRDQWKGAKYVLAGLASAIGGGVAALMEYLFHHH